MILLINTGLIVGIVVGAIILLNIVLVLVFGVFKKTGKIKLSKETKPVLGNQGEHKVNDVLSRINGSYLFSNYYIKDKNGNSHEIDHIFITKAGVFVIETKNISGEIHGSDNDEHWTQILGAGDICNIIRNPVKQNDVHCNLVQEIIGNNLPIFSLIVMVQNNTRDIVSENVIGLDELQKTIEEQETVMSMEDINTIKAKLEYSQAKDITPEEHIQNIHDLHDHDNL